MKKSLTAIIGMLFCITANSQEINAIVTRQGSSSNKSHYQLSETPKFVLDGDNINVMVGETQKEQFGISTDALNIIFGSVINDNVNENDLTVKHPVIIENNGILTVTGTMVNTEAENLVIEDGGQLVTGNSVQATVNKKIKGSNASKASNVNWYTISSPLAANTEFANVTNLIPNSVTDTDYDLYYLDEEKGIWVNSRLEDGANPDFKTIDKGAGYIYHNTNDTGLTFKGGINVEAVDMSLTSTADKGKGYNLIGNPFTQNIKMADVKGVTLADGFYILTNENTWGTKLTDSEIKPLQGFLVQATTAGNVTISKPTSSSKGERSNEQNTSIEVIVSNSNYSDNAYAMFGEGTGLNKVSHRNAQAPMIYIPQGNEDFAIAFMDENTTVFPVSFKAMTTGKYSISLKAT
ncbi:MAG: hypothetical protein MJZ47_06340, partial [Bacteroidales bacterium]|nr:hypothetical protein [Bacteroidales bacterium]